jgi:hypothetical protein
VCDWLPGPLSASTDLAISIRMSALCASKHKVLRLADET